MLVLQGCRVIHKKYGVPLSFEVWKLQFKKMLKECVLLSKSSFSLELSTKLWRLLLLLLMMLMLSCFLSKPCLSNPVVWDCHFQQLGQHGAARSFPLQGIQKLNTVTLPKTNMSSENRPFVCLPLLLGR